MKIISIMAILALLFTGAAAEESDAALIGGADGPTAIFLTGEEGFVTIELDANITTGYQWTGFVLGGESTQIDEESSGYVGDENPEQLEGLGGIHYFTLKAVEPGESIIRLIYARSWEEVPMREVILLAIVDEDMRLYISDVTEDGVFTGVVTEVNAEEHTVIMDSEVVGEVIAAFAEDMALPVAAERIRVFTDGTMSMSEPGIVYAIAWESIPDELAR